MLRFLTAMVADGDYDPTVVEVVERDEIDLMLIDHKTELEEEKEEE